MTFWTATMVLAALEITAIRRSAAQGHRLGEWCEAKRKLGKGARKSACVSCGKHAFLTPNGYARGRNKAVHKAPGIRGDAIFEACPSNPPTDLPLGSNLGRAV